MMETAVVCRLVVFGVSMSCYRPLRGYRSILPNESGKYSIVFKFRDGFVDLPMQVPCGKCVGCRMDNARAWAARCVHEASLHKENCVITLTYDGANPHYTGSLCKKDFQDFMKRLRFRFPSVRIRFFHCGEYGEKLFRPHYHALLFGFDFPDKVLYKVKNNIRLYRSAILESLWTYGISAVGDFSIESANYVARYVVKKEGGKTAVSHYKGRQPEYVTMSRRPGIGFEWFMKFVSDVYPHDYMVLDGGLKCKPPRFYDEKFCLTNEIDFRKIVNVRLSEAKANPDNKPYRLCARERVHTAKVGQYRREYEATGI